MGNLTYFYYAENDCQFVAVAYKNGLRGNAMGYLIREGINPSLF